MADSRWIIDADQNTFAKAVLETSFKTPVLVDFWAAWCGPCRTLGPILEKLANELAGRFILAKVDSDRNPNLSRQFKVKGIPSVKLVVDAKVVDEFTGALPESKIRAFLDKSLPSKVDRLAEQGMQLARRGVFEEAMKQFKAALDLDPSHANALLGTAQILMANRKNALAAELLDRLKPADAERPEVKTIKARLAFQPGAQDLNGLEWQVAATPDDLEARLSLGRALVGQQRLEEGLDHLLEVVRRDRGFQEDAGRKAVLQVFDMLGPTHPLVKTYRGRLASLLFS
ncbi:MAG: co-chaperone YbbN [Magnetococcales bacterium]|nr:co-chaperone YbbN [Magnetococcales bacterium]